MFCNVCHVLPCFTMFCHILPYFAIYYHVLPCFAMLSLFEEKDPVLFACSLHSFTSGDEICIVLPFVAFRNLVLILNMFGQLLFRKINETGENAKMWAIRLYLESGLVSQKLFFGSHINPFSARKIFGGDSFKHFSKKVLINAVSCPPLRNWAWIGLQQQDIQCSLFPLKNGTKLQTADFPFCHSAFVL